MGDFRQHAARLESLMRLDRVRLVVSDVHRAEMALNAETTAAARRWIEHGPPVWHFLADSHDIFRAELLGERAMFEVRRLTLEDLEATVAGVVIARQIKGFAEWTARAQNMSKRAARRAPGTKPHQHAKNVADKHRTAERVLRGDLSELPLWLRPFPRVLLAAANTFLRRDGRTLQAPVVHMKLANRGLSWLVALLEPRQVAAAVKRVGIPRDAPASALRAAVEQKEAGDDTRRAASGTAYDVLHLAYAAHCDVATIDRFNWDATAKVRAQLDRPAIFPVAHLAEVLAELERET